jgi:uncharacterized protein (TIGR02147 family)
MPAKSFVSPNDYRAFHLYLQDELISRCKRNPGFSLRAFARTLQINHSSLSRILNGKRRVSEKMQRSLVVRLGHPPDSIRNFSLDETSLETKMEAVDREFHQLSLDSFAVISEWYHYAILELTQVQNFRSDSKWMAKTLGITVSEVNAAVERLLRLNMLARNSGGHLRNTSGNNTNIDGEMRDLAKRNLQKQILELALRALDQTPLERRNQTSMTMAIHSKRLPEAVEMIADFRRRLSAFLEQDQERNDVYQLSVSLFPTTNLGGAN